MATERQIEANRTNAQLSTGPNTCEGKGIVRENALKHGLRASTFELVRGEDPAEFAERLEGWNRAYAPRNKVEADLVRQAVVVSWKIDRAVRVENAAINQNVIDAVLACDCEDDDRDSLIQAASLALFDAGPKGERIRRYEFALRREMGRIMSELAKVRKLTPAIDAETQPVGIESVMDAPDHVEIEGIRSRESGNGDEWGGVCGPLAPDRSESEPAADASHAPAAPAPNKANLPEPTPAEVFAPNDASTAEPDPPMSAVDQFIACRSTSLIQWHRRPATRSSEADGTACAEDSGSRPEG
jgi:hypothetical protein